MGLVGPGRSVTRRRTTHANTARSQFTSASIAPESSQGTCVCCSKLLRRAAAAQQAAPLCEMWSCLPRLPHLPPLRLILLLPRCLDVGRRHATPPPSDFPWPHKFRRNPTASLSKAPRSVVSMVRYFFTAGPSESLCSYSSSASATRVLRVGFLDVWDTYGTRTGHVRDTYGTRTGHTEWDLYGTRKV